MFSIHHFYIKKKKCILRAGYRPLFYRESKKAAKFCYYNNFHNFMLIGRPRQDFKPKRLDPK